MIELNSPIIVEGKRDVMALRNLGYKGELIELNDGKSILFTVEILAKKLGRQGIFVILMDWDRTGEKFTATDLAASLTFSRKIVSWFSFGSSMKYIRSNIWHSSASAFALDLGVLVNTKFFSFNGQEMDGMNIGMSISNYGTRMKFDGIDIYQPIDVSEYEEGNYGDVAGQFRPSEWELPLIFRIGIALKPIVSNFTNVTIAADALHPNNNSESINLGCSMDNTIPGFGVVSLRCGVKALYMDSSQYGFTGGLGIKMYYLGNRSLSIDYAYKTIGILGDIHVYTVGISF